MEIKPIRDEQAYREALRNRIESADSERESPEQILLGDCA